MNSKINVANMLELQRLVAHGEKLCQLQRAYYFDYNVQPCQESLFKSNLVKLEMEIVLREKADYLLILNKQFDKNSIFQLLCSLVLL